MKKLFLVAILSATCTIGWAKKVKFAVDMTGQTVSPNGVHVQGDFQALAGLGPDWDPGTAQLTKEGTTEIYSIVVNIPAFRKYEYRFVNGDQTYETEFVPDESRVGFDNIDNRWLYVDSLGNDTTFVGAIRFAANAPAGKKLIRYKVNMSYMGSQMASEIHVGTSNHNAFDPNKLRMYSFADDIYEYIDYTTDAQISYIFYNGGVLSSAETVPAGCAVAGKRQVAFIADTVVGPVCFTSCADCSGLGLAEQNRVPDLQVYPNPANDMLFIMSDGMISGISVTDISGKLICRASGEGSEIDLKHLPAGLYFLEATVDGVKLNKKIIIE